jgi:hypothetical protein
MDGWSAWPARCRRADYQDRRPVPLPDEWCKAVAAYEPGLRAKSEHKS